MVARNHIFSLIVVLLCAVFPFAIFAAPSCPTITYTLYRGRTDRQTNSQVTLLQRFLLEDPLIYPEGLVTGYFGVLTEKAVQRWQKAHGIVSFGTPQTTGYGMVGPKTKTAIKMACSVPTPPTPLP